MASCNSKFRKNKFLGQCPDLVSPSYLKPPLPSSPAEERSISRQEVAKSAIETTLLKSAGILSEFTTQTLSQTNTYFNHILAPERFGFEPLFQKKPVELARDPVPVPVQQSTNANKTNLRKKKPDISKLPKAIANILKDDSNSSIPSMNKSKKYYYHSKKMALKQRDRSKEKVTLLTASTENAEAPKIVVLSSPIQLENEHDSSKETKMVHSKNNNTSHSRTQLSLHSNIIRHKETTVDSQVPTTSTKLDKKIGANVKLNIGVDKGVAFILGSKTKSPYFNTFGSELEDNSIAVNAPYNRKWVVNVGNFLDEEISLVLVGNNLTITGFRQPSLNYPEGQTVSETISLPAEFDVNNLRVYRPNDAKALLVIQDKTQITS